MPKRMLIVDGYNVLRSGSHYSALRERMPDFGDEVYNAAREALINDVATFAGKDYEVLIVFDAANNRFSDGQPTKIGGMQVVFSPVGLSADSVIEEKAKQAAARGYEVLVITSDAATQWTVMGNNITRMSASGFYKEIQEVHEEAASPAEKVSEKNTLGERIPADVLKKLRERFG